jgi:hypothetical protein
VDIHAVGIVVNQTVSFKTNL